MAIGLYGKMAKRCGYQKMLKYQKTRVLPLRWIGNISGEFAGNHLVKAVYMDEDGDIGFSYRYHAFMWKYLNKPYKWWGTYYILDIKEENK